MSLQWFWSSWQCSRKIVGCGIGAKVCQYKNKDCIRIGMGMVSRGEVALIVAAKGNAVGLMSSSLLGPVVVVVVITTIISPILLKLSFSEKSGKVEYEQNEYARLMEEAEAAGKSDASRYVGESSRQNRDGRKYDR